MAVNLGSPPTLWEWARTRLSKFLGEGEERRYLITSRESRSDLASGCGKQLRLHKSSQDGVVDAVNDYVNSLFDVCLVEAVAFLASYVPPAPAELSVVLFMPLKRGNQDHAAALHTVNEAHATLCTGLDPNFSPGLSFVHTEIKCFDSQETHMKGLWDKDSSLELLALGVFQRS